jgi:hypothetical protein
MNRRQFAFFKGYIRDFAETLFMQNVIDENKRRRLASLCDSSTARSNAEELFSEKEVKVYGHQLVLRLKRLREMNGQEFDHIEVIFTGRKKRPKRRCFVGRRFVPRVEKTLRRNLRQVLEPYRIEVDWSGRDIRSVDIFPDIAKRIRAAHFCVFDNRATVGKANVYVEAGMAYMDGKPFIFFDYRPGKRKHDKPGPVPSDIAFVLSLRYRNYRELFRNFYFQLPVFFRKSIR